MSLTLNDTAKRYLLPHDGSFWKWSGDGETIKWAQGGTIVFVSELRELLAKLEESGLPPLDLVLMLLAATRENWRPFSEKNQEVSPKDLLEQNLISAGVSESLCFYLINELNRINDFDNDVRLSTPAKSTLIEMCLENVDNRLSVAASSVVLAHLDIDIFEWLYAEDYKVFHAHRDGDLNTDIPQMLVSTEPVREQSLRLRRQTGLEQIPEPVEEDLQVPTAQRVRSLLIELQQEPKLQGLAKVALQLAPVVTLPRPLNQHEDVAEGGISDIANRGTLDRLLISELANDDLTLAVRVAMNEALYLRKETPPSNENSIRTVILDCGVSMWGIPRVVGLATALAFAANNRDMSEFESYIVNKNKLEPVDLGSRNGIIKVLETLSSNFKIGKLENQFSDLVNEHVAHNELIVITSEHVAPGIHINSKLNDLNHVNLFVCSAGRDGALAIDEHTVVGKKKIKSVQVDLESILDTRSVVSSVPSELPAIFKLPNFPLYLPVSPRAGFEWPLGDQGYISFVGDRRALWFWSNSNGGRQLRTDVDTAQLVWHSPQFNGQKWKAIARKRHETDFVFFEFDQIEEELTLREFSLPQKPVAFCHYNDQVLVVFENEIGALDADCKLVKDTMIQTNRQWVSQRFFRDENLEWFALCTRNEAPIFERVFSRDSGNQFNFVFETEGVDGFHGVTNDGRVHNTFKETSKLFSEHNEEYRVVNVSYDGKWLELSSLRNRYGGSIVWSVDEQVARPMYLKQGQLNGFLIQNFVSHRQVRKRFLSVIIGKDGTIILQGKKQNLEFKLLHDHVRLLGSTNPSLDWHCRAEFEELSEIGEFGFKMQLARLPDGSKVWLDYRGLMHFKSVDPDIAEFTVVLTDEVCSGWSSDGKAWGSTYFTNKAQHEAQPTIFEEYFGRFGKRVVQS